MDKSKRAGISACELYGRVKIWADSLEIFYPVSSNIKGFM